MCSDIACTPRNKRKMYKCITALFLITFLLLPVSTQSVTVRNGYKPAKDSYPDAAAKVELVAIENAKLKGQKTPPASLITSVLLHESGHGKSKLAKQANNYFGIMAKKGEPYMLAFDDGRWKRFRKYANMQQSVQAYITLIGTKYAPALKEKGTYWQAKKIQQLGYATDKQYPRKISNTAKQYKLYRYD